MNEPLIRLDRDVPVPHIDQWLGYWLMEPERGLQKLAALQQMNIALHLHQTAQTVAAEKPQDDNLRKVRSGYTYEVRDGVAIAEISGTLMKHEASDESSTSTVMMRRTARAMMADPQCKAAIFLIDSPGGTVAGAYDLADDFQMLAAVKPCYAYVPDLMASAAYLQGSQMNGISAGRTALVGSIGTVGVVYDSSARASMMGIKVHVMRGSVDGKPAAFKGSGTPGTEITTEQLARWQEEIDDLNEQFLQAVEKGRKMSRPAVNAIADGGVWIAAKAKDLGLIDHVESFDQLFERVCAQVQTQSTAGSGGRSAPRAGQTETVMNETQPSNKFKAIVSTAAGKMKFEADSPEALAQMMQTAGIAAGVNPQSEIPPTEILSTAGSAPAAEPGALAPDAAANAQAAIIKETTMSQVTSFAAGTSTAQGSEPKPATIAELKAQFANDPGFALDCAEKALTMVEAKAAYSDVLMARNTELTQQNAQLKQGRAGTTSAAGAGGAGGGLTPTPVMAAERGGGAGTEAIENPKAEFEALVQEKIKSGKNRSQAVRAVSIERPELYEQFIAAANPGRKVTYGKHQVGRQGQFERTGLSVA